MKTVVAESQVGSEKAAPRRPFGILRSSWVLLVAVTCGFGLAAAWITLVRVADESGILQAVRSDFVQRIVTAVRVRDPGPVASGNGATPNDAPARAAPATPAGDREPVRHTARTSFAVVNARILSRGTDLAANEAACTSACPGTRTSLSMPAPGQRLDDPSIPRSVPDAVAPRREESPSDIAAPTPVLPDPTPRSGDVAVDTGGRAKVQARMGGAPHSPRAFTDARKSRALTRTARSGPDRLVAASQREALARAAERAARMREASLREIASPVGSAPNVRVYQFTNDGGRIDASGARIVTIR